MRNPVTPGAYNAVKRLAGGSEFFAGFGADYYVDQRIDRRVGDAGMVLRAFDGRRLRGEISAQRIARRRGKAEAVHRDIEIEIVDTFAVLNRVDDAHGGRNAERAEILDVGKMMRLQPRLVEQEFEAERLAVR